MSIPQFIVEPASLSKSTLVLEGQEFHHLRVRRLKIGDALVLCDGQGTARQGTVAEIHRDYAVIHLLGNNQSQSRTRSRFSIAISPLKGDRLDYVVEKLTELGSAEILLFESERTVRQVNDSTLSRLRRIAASATKQVHRSAVPVIHSPIGFLDLLLVAPERRRVLFWENATDRMLLRRSGDPGELLSVVGPEGGFADSEVEAAVRAGFEVVSLGDSVVRADTAAMVAACICRLWEGELIDQG